MFQLYGSAYRQYSKQIQRTQNMITSWIYRIEGNLVQRPIVKGSCCRLLFMYISLNIDARYETHEESVADSFGYQWFINSLPSEMANLPV